MVLGACEDWAAEDQITEELVVRRFGAPPDIDADALVGAAIDELIEAGLVESRD